MHGAPARTRAYSRAVDRITFAKDAPTALKGSDTALLVGTSEALGSAAVTDLFASAAQPIVGTLISATKPGDSGQVASSLTGAAPSRVSVGVLPKGGSRYTAPSRPDAIFRVLAGSGIRSAKKGAIVFVLADEAHLLPALGAAARAFPVYSRKSKSTVARVSIAAVSPDGTAIKISPAAKDHFKAVQQAALLVDSTPSDMNPDGLQEAAVALLKGIKGVKVKTFVGEALIDEGLTGIYSVGKAADSAPRMLVATYTPTRTSGPHVALVGKGVTFDTGGLHLKPRGGMEGMKCDMGGSAAVLGAFYALAKDKSTKHKVTLIMCMAENAIGPSSYKPDDVIDMHSGRSVEINNTDAEGRLVLADGVSWATRTLKADVVIDAATLTGAQMVATGTNHAAVVSNDEALEQLAVRAGQSSGDLVHPLPFAPEFYKPEFKSQIADMKNSVKNRANAQASCAAQFIFNHIEDTDIRWLHVDLAGPSFQADRGTGYGVGLLTNLVHRL